MPKGSYGLSPNQQAAQRVSLEEIMAKADSLPTPVQPRTVDDMQPLVKKLRDEKAMGWSEIEHWMRENTEFWRSGQFWKQIYTGKRMKLVSVETNVTPTLMQPQQHQLSQE